MVISQVLLEVPKITFMCMSALLARLSVHHMCAGTCAGQWRATDPLGLELQEVAGAENQAQILWDSRKCFELLSNLSSTPASQCGF